MEHTKEKPVDSSPIVVNRISLTDVVEIRTPGISGTFTEQHLRDLYAALMYRFDPDLAQTRYEFIRQGPD